MTSIPYKHHLVNHDQRKATQFLLIVMGKSQLKKWGSKSSLEEYSKKAYKSLKEKIIVEEKLEKVPTLEHKDGKV